MSPPLNYPPQKASTILKAADGSDDDEIMDDVGLGPSQFANESLGLSNNGNCDSDEELGDDHNGDKEEDRDEEEDGDLEDEEQLAGNWTSPIYAFFSPIPDITYDAKGHHAHEFCCTAIYCKGK